VNFTSL